MSTEATLNDENNMDAMERFFGMTEAFLCGEENTTGNLKLDPEALEREEDSLLFGCGNYFRDGLIPDGVSRVVGAVATHGPLCGSLQDTATEEDSIETSISDNSIVADPCNSETENSDSTEKRRRFWARLKCNGCQMVDAVVL